MHQLLALVAPARWAYVVLWQQPVEKCRPPPDLRHQQTRSSVTLTAFDGNGTTPSFMSLASEVLAIVFSRSRARLVRFR